MREDDIIAQIETDKVTIDIKYTGKQLARFRHSEVGMGRHAASQPAVKSDALCLD